MNGFVRRMAVLSVLWALCELLLPDGKQQPMARMTVSVLVMSALLSSLGQLLNERVETAAFTHSIIQPAQSGYHQMALRASANQVESYCVRQARKAGYDAQAAVWIRMDGTLEKIRLTLGGQATALLPPEELAGHLADQLAIDEEIIEWEGT